MKKILIVLVALFITNLGCKKMDEDNGGGLCACSPIAEPYFSLVVKNAAGEDLFNPATSGAYTKDQIQLLTKDVKGVIKEISYVIRPEFSYGDQKFNYKHLFSTEIVSLSRNSDNRFYLKLGDAEPLEISFKVASMKVEKLLIDNKEVPLAHSPTTNYSYLNSIFALTL